MKNYIYYRYCLSLLLLEHEHKLNLALKMGLKFVKKINITRVLLIIIIT